MKPTLASSVMFPRESYPVTDACTSQLPVGAVWRTTHVALVEQQPLHENCGETVEDSCLPFPSGWTRIEGWVSGWSGCSDRDGS